MQSWDMKCRYLKILVYCIWLTFLGIYLEKNTFKSVQIIFLIQETQWLLVINFVEPNEIYIEGPSWSWPWLYGSWIYNYLCNQCLSPLQLWVWTRSWQSVLYATLCDKICQWLATGRWFSHGTPASSTNKIDRHDITEILLKER
jgi:hypothetical protein